MWFRAEFRCVVGFRVIHEDLDDTPGQFCVCLVLGDSGVVWVWDFICGFVDDGDQCGEEPLFLGRGCRSRRTW